VAKRAHAFAVELRDRHPRWIRAVATTYDQADAALQGVGARPPGGHSVYVVQLRGRFVDRVDSRDPFFAGELRGRYAQLVLDRATCRELGHAIGGSRVRLRGLGGVVRVAPMR
jgi:hypothetical protein